MEDRNLPNKADELITEIANKDPLIPASISLVPYFGGALANFYSSKWQQISQRRTEELFSKFGEELKVLEEQAVKKGYFDTDEGIDLLFKATEESAKTRSEEKRYLIARVLRGATMANSAQGEYSPEEYLNLITDLTEKELRIARTIYIGQSQITAPNELESNNKAETWRLGRESLTRQHGIESDVLSLYLNRLHLAGLLDLHYVVAGHDEHGFAVQEEAVPTYWVSPAFRNLMEFLELYK